MAGFFSIDKYSTDKMQSNIPKCGICPCNNEKVKPYYGNGDKGILLVVDSPLSSSEFLSKQRIDYLKEVFAENRINLKKDCYITNAIRCPHSGPISKKVAEYCSPNLKKSIEEIQPSVIVSIGPSAGMSMLSVCDKSSLSCDSILSYTIPLRKYRTWYVPCCNFPIFEKKNEIKDILLRKTIKKSLLCLHKKKPDPVDFKKKVEIIMQPEKAAKILGIMQKVGSPVAFDYETNCLKPDSKGSKILTCAFSNGTKTIAYPWFGEAVEATSRILKSRVPKIACNLKFEDRWTHAKLNHSINNWAWDTLLAAHIIDNKPGVTSIKFQSFVLLGMETYNEKIEPYLKSSGSNVFNKIEQAPLKDILLYNGLDAFLEFYTAIKQYKILDRK